MPETEKRHGNAVLAFFNFSWIRDITLSWHLGKCQGYLALD